MSLDQVSSSALNDQLRAMDVLRLEHVAALAKITPAQEAANRLQAMLADLDGRLVTLAVIRVPADAERVAKLISGASVVQPDRKDVDDRAAKQRQIEAQQQQAKEDLAAVQGHIACLVAAASVIEGQISAANVRFYQDLAHVILQAYKQDAVEFVSRHIPRLHSVVRRLQQVAGQGPGWESHIFGGLKIVWYEDEVTQASPHHPPVKTLTALWPRTEGSLASGAPIHSDAVLEEMISEIRSASVDPATEGSEMQGLAT